MSQVHCNLLNCPVIDPHYHTAKGTEFSRIELIEVMVDRDAWKARAEALAGALRDLLNHNSPVPDKDGNPIPYQANPQLAIEALADFEKA